MKVYIIVGYDQFGTYYYSDGLNYGDNDSLWNENITWAKEYKTRPKQSLIKKLLKHKMESKDYIQIKQVYNAE